MLESAMLWYVSRKWIRIPDQNKQCVIWDTHQHRSYGGTYSMRSKSSGFLVLGRVVSLKNWNPRVIYDDHISVLYIPMYLVYILIRSTLLEARLPRSTLKGNSERFIFGTLKGTSKNPMRGYFVKYPSIGYFGVPLGYFAKYPYIGKFGVPLFR